MTGRGGEADSFCPSQQLGKTQRDGRRHLLNLGFHLHFQSGNKCQVFFQPSHWHEETACFLRQIFPQETLVEYGRKVPLVLRAGSSPRPEVCSMNCSPHAATKQLKPLPPREPPGMFLYTVVCFCFPHPKKSAFAVSILGPSLRQESLCFLTCCYKDVRLASMLWLYPQNSTSWSKKRSRRDRGEGVVTQMSLRQVLLAEEFFCEHKFQLCFQQQVCTCAHLRVCVCTCVRMGMCVCFLCGWDLADREQVLKMLSHHVLARDTWPELGKLLRDQPQPKLWELPATQIAYKQSFDKAKTRNNADGNLATKQSSYCTRSITKWSVFGRSLNTGVQCECFITHALNSIFSEIHAELGLLRKPKSFQRLWKSNNSPLLVINICRAS